MLYYDLHVRLRQCRAIGFYTGGEGRQGALSLRALEHLPRGCPIRGQRGTHGYTCFRTKNGRARRTPFRPALPRAAAWRGAKGTQCVGTHLGRRKGVIGGPCARRTAPCAIPACGCERMPSYHIIGMCGSCGAAGGRRDQRHDHICVGGGAVGLPHYLMWSITRRGCAGGRPAGCTFRRRSAPPSC